MKFNDVITNPNFKDRLAQINKVKVDRNYDIPYLGGYSKDGFTVYIDRHIPDVIEGINVISFLKIHEIAEKAIIDIFDLDYKQAHQLATKIERMMVERKEVSWKDYSLALKPFIKTTAHEKLVKVPKDLDLTPYVDSQDYRKLKALIKNAR